MLYTQITKEISISYFSVCCFATGLAIKNHELLHDGGHASRGKSARDICCRRILFNPMHIKKIFDLENKCQGHGVQHLQWSHSIANINLYKCHTWVFFPSSHSFRDIHISKFVTLNMQLKVTMYNIRSDAIQW